MDAEPETVPRRFDFTTLVPKIWRDEEHGLEKTRIEFTYSSIDKANEFARVCFSTENINLDNVESNILESEKTNYWYEMGSAETPLDYYIELILQQMLTGEKSRCSVKRSSDKVSASFTIKLQKIEFRQYMFELSPKQLLEVARKYKEIGVRMFKKYPKFAQMYFNKAAKLILSLSPIEELDADNDDVNPGVVLDLLHNLYVNIAACLLKESRYDDVISILKFTADQLVEDIDPIIEKALFRKAVAYYNLNKLLEAKKCLESLDYKSKPECLKLHKDIEIALKKENQAYESMVKKMFV